MDAEQALRELAEISSQIELALIFNSRGELIGTTLADRQAAEALAFAAAALLMCSSQAAGEEHGEPTQVELSYPEASVLLVREGDLRIVALASPDLIAGLAFFELRTCLRKLIEGEAKRSFIGARWARLVAALQPKRSEHEATSPGSGRGADDTSQ
jgi:predicted regulator of Ras-like GTPase activity (Roadblock/LC7/MglB family)